VRIQIPSTTRFAQLPKARASRSSFVAVIAIALMLAGCGGDEAASQATATSMTTTNTVIAVATPLELANQWIAAFEAGDVATYQGLMHPDAVAACLQCGYDRPETAYFDQIGEGTRDVADSRLLALGNGSLHATCAADGPVVTCETLRSTDFGHHTAEGEPTQQWNVTFELTFEDGLVTRRVLIENEGAEYDRARVAAYETWLRESHPDAHADLFVLGTILLTTVEQFEQHREYVSEYWASR
jgi:hypothetical protein